MSRRTGNDDQIQVGGQFARPGWLRAICLLAMLLLGGGVRHSPAAEPVAIAGIVEPVPNPAAQLARYTLRSARSGRVVAGLLDPRGLIFQTPARLVLQTDRLPGADVTGLPLFAITGVTPEFWAQPASYGPHQKGPGGFAAVSDEVLPVDWAGRRVEDLRATELDGGLDADTTVSFTGNAEPPVPPPLNVNNVQFNGRLLQLGWQGVAGVVYQLLFAAEPQGPYTVLEHVGAAASGEVTFSVSTSGAAGFYKIAVAPPAP